MKVLCAGLSKTGTTSIHSALQILGFKSIHYDLKRLSDIVYGQCVDPDFCRYDDVDAVGDIPSAFFFRELTSAYPESKVILTVRNTEDWWRSIDRHFRSRFPIVAPGLSDYAASLGDWDRIRQWKESNRFRKRLRTIVYGAPVPEEFLYKKRFVEHNLAVQSYFSPERLLVVDVTRESDWGSLCEFLGKPVPDSDFPHSNQTPRTAQVASV